MVNAKRARRWVRMEEGQAGACGRDDGVGKVCVCVCVYLSAPVSCPRVCAGVRVCLSLEKVREDTEVE